MANTALNRRRILAGTAAALSAPVAAVPALAAVSAGPHPDAALLAVCERFRADWTAMNLLPDVEDEVVDEAGDRLWDLEDEIAEVQATTFAGLAAKAGVLRTGYQGIMIEVNHGLLDSLLQDIEALDGRRA